MPDDLPNSSRLPGFYKLTAEARIRVLTERGLLSEENGAFLLESAGLGLPLAVADRMVENAIGVLGIPIGLGLNFRVNGKDYVIPMAVEEPSVVAAVSGAAKLVRAAGGFQCEADPALMLGQIQMAAHPDPQAARRLLLDQSEQILEQANALCSNMVARGGGAREIDVRVLGPVRANGNGDRTMVVVHVLIDTRDAMGANTVNTVMEGLAPAVERIAGGGVHMRILSNLSDRCRGRARCVVPASLLGRDDLDGAEAARRIRLASLFAEEDPYRAATHNKGIMNGIDAVALATGNDWRAVEAGAHAFAARHGRYGPLAKWHVSEAGELIGELELPLAVGTVGGPTATHPTVRVLRDLLGVETGVELREVIAAVGLAQNLAALRALTSEGIQRGHMALHARSVALSAGTPPELVDVVVKRLIDCGEVKVWKAEEILEELGSAGI